MCNPSLMSLTLWHVCRPDIETNNKLYSKTSCGSRSTCLDLHITPSAITFERRVKCWFCDGWCAEMCPSSLHLRRLDIVTDKLSFSLCVSVEAGGKKLRSTIQRSTETGLAVEMRSRMTRQASRESTDGSMNSYSSEGKWVTKHCANVWSHVNMIKEGCGNKSAFFNHSIHYLWPWTTKP